MLSAVVHGVLITLMLLIGSRSAFHSSGELRAIGVRSGELRSHCQRVQETRATQSAPPDSPRLPFQPTRFSKLPLRNSCLELSYIRIYNIWASVTIQKSAPET